MIDIKVHIDPKDTSKFLLLSGFLDVLAYPLEWEKEKYEVGLIGFKGYNLVILADIKTKETYSIGQ